MCCHANYALTCCFLEQKTLLYQPIYSYYCSTYLFLASISLLFKYEKENIVYFIVRVITFYSSIRHTLQNCLELFHKSIQNWIRTADGVWLVFHINMHYARTVSFFVYILTDIITNINIWKEIKPNFYYIAYELIRKISNLNVELAKFKLQMLKHYSRIRLQLKFIASRKICSYFDHFFQDLSETYSCQSRRKQ